MTLPVCPHCRIETPVHLNLRTYGWCVDFYDDEGKFYESNLDGVRTVNSDTIRCPTCNTIRRDLKVVHDRRGHETRIEIK